MAEIRLSDGTIHFREEWLSAEDIKARIKKKMDAGDMKFADLAAALEELNRAMENAQIVEVRLVLAGQDYEKLRQRGGEDDNESVRKAILAFIEGGPKKAAGVVMEAPAHAPDKPAEKAPPPEADAPPQPEDGGTIACSKCKRPIKIPTAKRPLELECDFCGTSILLPAEEKDEDNEAEKGGEAPKSIRHQDHFIG